MTGPPLRSTYLPLGVLLLLNLADGLFVASKTLFQAPNIEHLCGATEFALTHRIAGDFVPVGYSGLLGVSQMFRYQYGMTALTILFSLLLVAAIWFYLRTLRIPPAAAFVILACFSFYPDFLLSFHKAQDTAPTAILLFAFSALLIRAVEERRFGLTDLLLAVTMGYAALVRPNLMPLPLVVWLAFHRYRTERPISRAATQLAIAGLIYLLGTTAFHGRPFFPQNGLYNLYAGSNEYTETYISNEETSIPFALTLHGVPNWVGQQCATPKLINGVPEVRLPVLNPVYRRLTLEFAREHPKTMIRLVWVKFKNMMYPDFRIYPPRSVAGVLKIIAALSFPLWFLALLFLRHPGPPQTRFIICLMLAFYLAPFLVVISSPRFRTPMDYFFWTDLAAMLVLWRSELPATA